MNQKGFANIVLIVLIAVLAGILGYVTLVKKPAIKPEANIPVGWKIYSNNEYGFSIFYQKDLEPSDTARAWSQEENYPAIVFYGDEEAGRPNIDAEIIVYKGQAAISKERPTTDRYFRLEQISLNSIPALKVTRTEGFSDHFYWVERGDLALYLVDRGEKGVQNLDINSLSW